ncbi:MAG: transposase [Pirellulales bacterium]|nr:transposase [Pirellulales bacterium]
MSDYRRYFVQGGSYFFTLVVDRRRPLFRNLDAVRLLGDVLRDTSARWPMTVHAIVLLPDHLHTIWSLPSGDSAYSKRLGWAKKEFTKQWLAIGGHDHVVSTARKRARRRGVWQPRFWEHTLRDEEDFERHFDYIHWNPVKHGYVRRPKDWPHSSFHRWVRQDVYPQDWGCGTPMEFSDIEDSVGEP